jgi:hypothetical protein
MSALRVLSQAATWMRKISRSNTRIPSSFENQLFSIKLPFTKRKKDNIINGRLLAKDIQFNLQKKLSSFTERNFHFLPFLFFQQIHFILQWN